MATKTLGRTQVRDRSQVTLPATVKKALHVDSGDELEFVVDADSGVVTVVGLKSIRADQAWFWTVEWQAGEADAEADIAAGRGTIHMSGEEFLASLTT